MKNIVILAGNVGAAPEVRNTQGGTKIANFSLATSRPKYDSERKVMKDGEGRTVQETEWHRVTCFGPLAASLKKYLEKGQKVMVEGRIHYTEWTDENDNKRYGVEIIAEDVAFLSRGKSQQQGTNTGGSDADLEDDVPF